MSAPAESPRPWWKLHLSTWFCGEVILVCLLYLNIGLALAAHLTEDDGNSFYSEAYLCGWPIPCWELQGLPSLPFWNSPNPIVGQSGLNRETPLRSENADGAIQKLETRRDYLAQFGGGGVGGGGSAGPRPILIGPLVFDIAAGLLVLAAVVFTTELLRRRYPDLLQITILQCLALTAFVAVFLAVYGWRNAAINEIHGYAEMTPAQNVCASLQIVCQIFVIAVAVCCALFLARPRWWRNRRA